MNENVLIIVAHSDDETISMAGTICKHIKKGDKVYVSSMTNGVGSRPKQNDSDINERKFSAMKASQILGFQWIESYDFDDNSMDNYPLIQIVKCIENIKTKYKPSLIYTHSNSDLNIDHRVVLNAVLTAFRPQPGELCKEIRLFEVPSSTDYSSTALSPRFNPNLFIDISNFWDKKLLALKSYDSEMREYPHSRSIDGILNLSRRRGNQVGFDLAEAFEVVRKLED